VRLALDSGLGCLAEPPGIVANSASASEGGEYLRHGVPPGESRLGQRRTPVEAWVGQPGRDPAEPLVYGDVLTSGNQLQQPRRNAAECPPVPFGDHGQVCARSHRRDELLLFLACAPRPRRGERNVTGTVGSRSGGHARMMLPCAALPQDGQRAWTTPPVPSSPAAPHAAVFSHPGRSPASLAQYPSVPAPRQCPSLTGYLPQYVEADLFSQRHGGLLSATAIRVALGS